MSVVDRTHATMGEAPWPCEKMGVEFEGGWGRLDTPASIDRYYRDVVESRRFVQHGDGSVRTTESTEYRGEWVTLPRTCWADIVQDVNMGYADVVNDSCGMHVHTSWSPVNYSRLADHAFWGHFTSFWSEVIRNTPASWNEGDCARVQRRLNGAQYCRKEFHPLEQMRGPGDRYTQLNYCYKKHKTLECRMLPMFESLQAAVDAVRLLLECYDSYLRGCTDSTETVAEPPVDISMVDRADYTEELVSVTVPERLVIRDIIDTIPEAVMYEDTLSDVVDTSSLEELAEVHQDFLRRAPAGHFKMLELGHQEPRAVRDRVKAFLRKLGAESDD